MHGGPKKPTGTPKGRIVLQPLKKPESAAAAPQKLDTTTPGHIIVTRETTEASSSTLSSSDSDSTPNNSPTSVQSPRDGRETPPHITHSNSASPLSGQVSPLVLPDDAEEYLSGAAAPPNTYREASPNLPPVRQPNPSNAAAAENPLQAKLKLGAEIAARKGQTPPRGLKSKTPGVLQPLKDAPQAASAAASAAGAQSQVNQKNVAGAQLQPLKDAPRPETTASRIARIVADAGVQPTPNASGAGPSKEDQAKMLRKPTATGYRAHGPLAPLNTGKPPAEKKADAVNPLDKQRKPLGK